ncbi:MAG TPA: 4Fe-4S dicluster domain-containing protein [Rudaea sp.]|jgi:molybdopterin-containing oxidoreductase family iron-sulfur binding subunit|nr:4Fe-4S dicluster domain-containing protein [Rudaea sp.]
MPSLTDAAIESRRDFLKALALSVGGSALVGCARAPDDPIIPSVADRAGEDLPMFYATALTRNGYANGVLVKTRYGHPIKIEGNPSHPASLGGTDIFSQANIFSLWSDERSKSVLRRGSLSSWPTFGEELAARLATSRNGSGVRILAEPSTSPTLQRLKKNFLARFPAAAWHTYQSLSRDNVYAGAKLAFGEALETRYDFTRCDVMVALDADFLTTLPGSVRYAHDFATRRTHSAPTRVYSLETSPNAVSILADHRRALRPNEIHSFAAALLDSLDNKATDSPFAKWRDAIVADLSNARGRSIVVCADHAPPELHAVVHTINAKLGNLGATIFLAEPLLDETDQLSSLRTLTDEMRAGNVETLLVIGGDPAYTAPADFAFAGALDRVAWSAHLATENDETSLHCDWHLPLSQELEAWGDARAFDGTASVQQPTIAPLHDSKSGIEWLAMALGESTTGHDLVRETWRSLSDDVWKNALRDGVVANSSAPSRQATLRTFDIKPPSTSATDTLDFVFRADPTVGDGAHAGNAWLQELPKPFTQLTWSNAALLGPETAKRLGIVDEDVIRLVANGVSVEAPVIVQDGHAEQCVTLPLGYGRTRAGGSASGIGFDAGALRVAERFWQTRGTVQKTGFVRPLARTQRHAVVGKDSPVRVVAGDAAIAPNETQPSLFAPRASTTGYAWGMAINLDACIGCNTCTIACQSENNISSVGRDQVRRGRAMHWIRIDHYVEPAAQPRLHAQPVPCMHCEDAPCELVCPVGATVHDSEGLNLQVYNRCVGTRFCSNNCPYKVRRFNFLQFSTEASRDSQNPDVTVRNRGVMEKCTYCIQRIETARIETDRDGRKLRDGEVLTACQAACPTSAIVFGDINDPSSAVSRAKADTRNYALLGELNTRPRTTYLAKRRNARTELDE